MRYKYKINAVEEKLKIKESTSARQVLDLKQRLRAVEEELAALKITPWE